MTIDEIRWMLELFETGKMSKAAENLYISQPALSQCVQRIEQQLGFRLFERSNKGLNPTPKGQLFYEAAVDITTTYQHFLTRAELLDRQQLTDITIGMAPFLAYCCSVHVVRDLRCRFPDITFHIYEASTQQLLEALRSGRVQLIIISDSMVTGEFSAHPFAQFPCGVFLRKGSPLADRAYVRDGKRYLDPAELAQEPLCITCPGQASRKKADLLLREANITPTVAMESRHITSLYRYALEGMATALCPITGESVRVDREAGASLIYLIPEHYENAHSRLAICTLPDLEKRIPPEVYDIISHCITSSPDFGCEAL